MTTLSRRRFLAISAGALCAGAAGASLAGVPEGRIWRGIALGARAEIRLGVESDSAAADIIGKCLAEIERLENLFSLHRRDSAISRLNRDGYLDAPDQDFLTILSLAANVYGSTGGVFDPTVQPLWDALARAHVAHGGTHEEIVAANASARRNLGARIGFDKLNISSGRLEFGEPGMALTLNGIAQGYITDRIAGLLRDHGLSDVLVNMGEHRALGGRPDGTPWPVRLSGRDHIVLLRDSALATSSTSGTTFDQNGAASHIIHPRLGVPARISRQVSVEAPTAALADGLSTAFCLMDEGAIARTAADFGSVRVF
jgi:thiamine biosynthesis lipoprotein